VKKKPPGMLWGERNSLVAQTAQRSFESTSAHSHCPRETLQLLPVYNVVYHIWSLEATPPAGSYW